MARRTQIDFRRIPVRHLSENDLNEIWLSYRKYADCPREKFVRTVRSSSDLILLFERTSGRMIGFEASKILATEWLDKKHVIIFTFYTNIEPNFRGKNILQRLYFRRFLAIKLRYPLRPQYWMFTASTYTSFLLLPRNFVDYWPRRGRATPESVRSLMDKVMRHLGAEGWDPQSGTLKRHGSQRYREGVVADDRRVLADPDIRFYAKLNPGQHRGDSLACLCPLTWGNFLSVLRNVLRRLRRASRQKIAGGLSRLVHGGAVRL